MFSLFFFVTNLRIPSCPQIRRELFLQVLFNTNNHRLLLRKGSLNGYPQIHLLIGKSFCPASPPHSGMTGPANVIENDWIWFYWVGERC